MLLIQPVHGQVILCFGARILMILKIGIGVIGMMVNGTTNHCQVVIKEHTITSLLALLAPFK